MSIAKIENGIEDLLRKQAYFDNLKIGDRVKVPVRNRVMRVRIVEKYKHHIVVMHSKGYKVSFSMGDIITSLGKTVGSKVNESE